MLTTQSKCNSGRLGFDDFFVSTGKSVIPPASRGKEYKAKAILPNSPNTGMKMQVVEGHFHLGWMVQVGRRAGWYGSSGRTAAGGCGCLSTGKKTGQLEAGLMTFFSLWQAWIWTRLMQPDKRLQARQKVEPWFDWQVAGGGSINENHAQILGGVDGVMKGQRGGCCNFFPIASNHLWEGNWTERELEIHQSIYQPFKHTSSNK